MARVVRTYTVEFANEDSAVFTDDKWRVEINPQSGLLSLTEYGTKPLRETIYSQTAWYSIDVTVESSQGSLGLRVTETLPEPRVGVSLHRGRGAPACGGSPVMRDKVDAIREYYCAQPAGRSSWYDIRWRQVVVMFG